MQSGFFFDRWNQKFLTCQILSELRSLVSSTNKIREKIFTNHAVIANWQFGKWFVIILHLPPFSFVVRLPTGARQIILCRATATLRRPQTKQYIAWNEGVYKTKGNIVYFWQSMKRCTTRHFRKWMLEMLIKVKISTTR